MVLREYNNFRRYTGNTRENTYDYKNFNRNYSGRSRFPLYDGIDRVYTFRYLYFTLSPTPILLLLSLPLTYILSVNPILLSLVTQKVNNMIGFYRRRCCY